MEAGEFFVFYLMTPIALSLGFFGNTMGILVLMRKKMQKIGPVYIYRFMFISDSIFMLQMINPFLLYIYGRNLMTLSEISCKLISYLAFGLFSLTPMLLIYISIEKLISIKYPTKKFLMRKKKWQFRFTLFMIIAGLITFLPSFFFSGIITTTSSNNLTSTLCTFKSAFGQQVVSITNLVIRVFIAYGVMTLCSVLLLISIFQMRKRIVQNFLSNLNLRQNQKYRKDIKLAITSILLNFTYLMLNVPYSVYISIPNYYVNQLATASVAFLFYYGFCLNFYLLLISNKLTRKEFINMITFKK